MKTISFYSYKGGVGRTFLLCNIARFLYQLGKKVLILDFDFYAPGVAVKFGRPLRAEEYGLIDILSTGEGGADGLRRGLEKALKEVNLGENPRIDGGYIKYIPPGGTSKESYWETLQNPDWVLNFDTDTEPYNGFRIYFLREALRDAISKLDPAPDFVLIDSMSGYTRYGRVVNQLLAEKTVFLFAHNTESQEALPYFINKMLVEHEAKVNLCKSLNIEGWGLEVFPVLSRAPYANRETDPQSAYVEMLKDFDLTKVKPLHVIHADSQLSMDESLRHFPNFRPLAVAKYHEEVLEIMAEYSAKPAARFSRD